MAPSRPAGAAPPARPRSPVAGFYPAPSHAEALDLLVQTLSGQGRPTIVIGDAGSGKSLVGKLALAAAESSDVLRFDAGGIHRFAKSPHAPPPFSGALIDNAELLEPADALELRARYSRGSGRGLALLGATALMTALQSAEWRWLRAAPPRIVRLTALSRGQLPGYFATRLRLSLDEIGALFTPPALDQIQRLSGGVPRALNNWAAAALRSAARGERTTVLAADVSIDPPVRGRPAAARPPAPDPRAPVDTERRLMAALQTLRAARAAATAALTPELPRHGSAPAPLTVFPNPARSWESPRRTRLILPTSNGS